MTTPALINAAREWLDTQFPQIVSADVVASLAALLEQHAGQKAGYKLVPLEPTLDQLRAYCDALENPAAARKEMWHHAKARKRYRAMVLAAPGAAP